MDRVPLESTKTPENPPLTPTQQSSMGKSTDSILYNRMADFFEVDGERKDSKVETKIKDLTEWGKKNGEDRLLIQTALRQLQMSLGLNDKGKNLVEKLHKYISIDKQIKALELDAANL